MTGFPFGEISGFALRFYAELRLEIRKERAAKPDTAGLP